MEKCVIGVDIGGTKVAAGVVTSGGKLKCKVVLPTLADKGREESLGQAYNSIERLVAKSGIGWRSISGIGVCAPGPLDPSKGIIHNPPNLPGWREVPLVSLFQKKFKKKTRLENDANAAGMAELIWGAAKGYKHVFYVTISTGIGTGIIIGGKIYHGKNGMAAEGGHTTINYDGKHAVCNCGNIGCIETLASGPGTVRQLLRKTPKNKICIASKSGGITMADVGKAARDGDKIALSAISEQAKFLGVWLGNMISVLDPEIIVVGGGVSLLGNLLFKQVRKVIPAHTINPFAAKTPVVQAELKKDVGIFGAASVVLR